MTGVGSPLRLSPDRRGAGASAAEYRELMCAFPTGVAVVTTVDAGGAPCGMTCSSIASVTLDPPTLLVCLRVGSRTCVATRSRGAFAVNLLHAQARPVAELFAGSVANRFARVRWRRTGSGLPWLVDDAFALADCTVTRSVEVGDHCVVFGTVRQIIQRPAAPLLYGLRQFSSWGELACSA
jgi:flavin reductase (DIM6/NTAB) family NADH-FMN oxidoreductase RutF